MTAQWRRWLATTYGAECFRVDSARDVFAMGRCREQRDNPYRWRHYLWAARGMDRKEAEAFLDQVFRRG